MEGRFVGVTESQQLVFNNKQTLVVKRDVCRTLSASRYSHISKILRRNISKQCLEWVQGHLVTGWLLVHSWINLKTLQFDPMSQTAWATQNEKQAAMQYEIQAMKADPLHYMNTFLHEDVTVWRFCLWPKQIKALGAFWVLMHRNMSIRDATTWDVFPSSISSSEQETKGRKPWKIYCTL